MSVWEFAPNDNAPEGTKQFFALDVSLHGILSLDNGRMCLFKGYRNEGSGFATAPVPVASVLQDGITGTTYSETISVVNGTSPFTFSVSSGSLPTGLPLNSSTGIISGTPTVAGTFTFTVQVTDSGALTGSQSFSITITAPTSGGGETSHTFVC